MLDPAYFPVSQMLQRGGMKSEFFKASPCPGTTTSIIDELHLFNLARKGTNKSILLGTESIIGATINWELSDNTVLVDTVVVTDITGTIIYESNIDYTITDKGVLERLSGNIEDGSIVRVSYDYHETCIDSKTGTPRITCKTCLGEGTVYPEQGIPIIGLFHIPSIDDRLVKSGVLRLGEAVYTTSNHIDITTNFDDETKYWLRDKLVINKTVYTEGAWVVKPQEWIIIKPPSPININSTYLANRLYIRLKNQRG